MGIDLGVSTGLDDLGRHQRGSGGTAGFLRPILGTDPLDDLGTHLSCECVLVVLEGVDGLRQPHVHTANDTLRTRRAPELVSDEHHGVWQRC